MVFFDLNIPYHESTRHLSTSTKTKHKTTRLKLATTALTLGYTSVAYNHSIKGLISDSHRCSIPRFTLPSLLTLSPNLIPSIAFTRSLLNIPKTTPFRQYTRVTVVVGEDRYAPSLNQESAVLKTYDLVAVKPKTQLAFELACEYAKVDIISIDFSEKLPFRMKQSMVQAAVKRGVYFEITYSSLIVNAQERGQMISNVKLLVAWTRGRSLIISSGAPSATELRGPYDAANLSSLLGLTMEKSKAAISKNCRSLIANAFRKKYCYKEVIKVEKLPTGEEMNFDDWLNWDPISSAEGDLALDDMGKSFSASYKVSKAAKAIDFTSALNGIPSHGLLIKDIISRTVAVAEPFALSKDITTPGDQGLVELVCETPEQPPSFCSLSKEKPALAHCLVEPSGSDLEVSLPCDLSNFISSEQNDVDAVAVKEVENVHVLDSKNVEQTSSQALSRIASDKMDALLSNAAATICAEMTDIFSSQDQCAFGGKSIPINGSSSSPFHCDQSKLSNSVRLDIFTQSGTIGRSLADGNQGSFVELQVAEAESVLRSDKDLPLASCDESLHDNSIEGEARDTSNQIETKRVSRNDEEHPPVLYEEAIQNNCIEKNRLIEERETSIVQSDGFPVEKSDDNRIIDNEDLILNKFPSILSYERLVDEDVTGTSDLSAAILDEPHVTNLCNHIKTEDCSVAQDDTVDHETITSQTHTDGHARTNSKLPDNSSLGRGGVKRKISGRISLFPFKRFISPRPLRKKARK